MPRRRSARGHVMHDCGAYLIQHGAVGSDRPAMVHPVTLRLPGLPHVPWLLLPAAWHKHTLRCCDCVGARQPDDGHCALLCACSRSPIVKVTVLRPRACVLHGMLCMQERAPVTMAAIVSSSTACVASVSRATNSPCTHTCCHSGTLTCRMRRHNSQAHLIRTVAMRACSHRLNRRG